MRASEQQNAAAGVGARNGAESTAQDRTGSENTSRRTHSQSADRYVRTRDAQQAVQGHEVEIVQALGIQWRAGQRDHIRCPYPDHGGASDWRLNNKGRAICTCTGGKTDSVFDIAGKVEGLDFEASKVRCVEIVGRTDLIREKGAGGSFQATDARSLLQAPPERRDDSLPRAYLAHRLGIEPDAVPTPSTPMVGIRSLAYFDPPKGKGTGKPILVGEYPCVVFGQINAERQQHAHRIYVENKGRGKRALGIRSDGKERDPKKSARVLEEGVSTAGRVALWGDSGTAPWGIIAEGIETAAAVAFAFRTEIERREAYVVAGINAGGIEAFTPWPATKRVTVAADRDEAATILRPNPTRRGEAAARTFGIRNHPGMAVAYALPGAPGTATDWLDIHCADGTEAVRSGILSAVAYVPTEGEIAEERDRREGVAELECVRRDYPLPELDTFTLTYQRTPRGQIKVHRYIKVGDSFEEQPVSSPWGIVAWLRFADEGDAYGTRAVVEDRNRRPRYLDIDRATLARQGGAEVRSALLAAGFRTEDDGDLLAVRCLKAADPAREIVVVKRPGWHTPASGGDRFFVCPGGRIIGAPENETPELSVNTRISAAVACGGTLEGYKEAVAAACTAPKCEHWTIGAIAGFCAPLLALAGLDTCGINLSGMTSGGKTTAQRLAVAPWSRAALDQRDSLLQSARATANGIELMASRSNGTVLAMDELGHVAGKELGRIIYSLASGVGKTRMGADAQLRASYTWSTFVVLSSEKSLEEKVRGDGGEWAGGMAVRIPDVDISGIDRAVDQAVLAKIQTVDRHFGHAGPAFVEALIAAGYHREGDSLRAGIKQSAVAIAGPNADGKHIRAAEPFAVLVTAGKLAQKFGLLPSGVDVMRAVRWAWDRFADSTDATALDPEQQAVTNLRGWIAARWRSEVLPTVPDDGRAPNRNASGWFDDVAVYIPTANIVAAAGGALKEAEIARALHGQGFIAKRHDDSCFYASYVPRVGKVKVYALKREAFGRSLRDDEDAQDAREQQRSNFGLFQGGRA